MAPQFEKFAVFTTGGTIAAKPYHRPSHPPKFVTALAAKHGNPVFHLLGDFGYTDHHYNGVPFPPVDSQKINAAYLYRLVTAICATSERNILLVIGTDGTLRVARYLQRLRNSNPQLHDKNILLVGSMIPALKGPMSDAHANLKYAAALMTGKADDPHFTAFEKQGLGIVLSTYHSRPQPFRHHANLATRREKHFVPCLYTGRDLLTLSKFREPGKGHRNRLVGWRQARMLAR